MAKGTRYSTEFKQEAVKQVTAHGYPVADVAERLGISTKALYNWIGQLSKPPKKQAHEQDLQAEIARLKRELKRTKQERDILKEAAVFFASERTLPVHKISQFLLPSSLAMPGTRCPSEWILRLAEMP